MVPLAFLAVPLMLDAHEAANWQTYCGHIADGAEILWHMRQQNHDRDEVMTVFLAAYDERADGRDPFFQRTRGLLIAYGDHIFARDDTLAEARAWVIGDCMAMASDD